MAAILIRFACSSSSFRANSVIGAAPLASASAACADVSSELPIKADDAEDGTGMPFLSAFDAGTEVCVPASVLVVSDDVLARSAGVGETGASEDDRLAVSRVASSTVGIACKPDGGVCEFSVEAAPTIASSCMLAGSGGKSDAAFSSMGSILLATLEGFDPGEDCKDGDELVDAGRAEERLWLVDS